NEEFDAEDAMAAERLDDLARLVARGLQRSLRDVDRLPAFAVIAGLLAMTDRRAEQHAVLGCDREESDLTVKGDEFLDDHSRPVSAHFLDCVIPRLPHFLGSRRGALALAGARHHRLDDARQPDLRGPRDRFVAAFGEAIFGSDEPK